MNLHAYQAKRLFATQGIPVPEGQVADTAPPGRHMGHAGAIVSVGEGSAGRKIEALRQAGALISELPEQTVTLLGEVCH